MTDMKNLVLDRLRGSLLRCLLLTGQPSCRTAEILTNLLGLPNGLVSSHTDIWMPRGLRDHKETMLVDSSDFIPSNKAKILTEWWLEKPLGATLPNWDIASTCLIDGVKGLLLVEAKAHDKELSKAGKQRPTTRNGQMNHIHIGLAIEEANSGLNRVIRGWALSRDTHYQLSNRFAWVWKLATLGVPVVLIYLGFLDATEMLDQGQPFDSSKAWNTCIRGHANNIVPDAAWERRLETDNTPFWFLIRSVRLKLEIVNES